MRVARWVNLIFALALAGSVVLLTAIEVLGQARPPVPYPSSGGDTVVIVFLLLVIVAFALLVLGIGFLLVFCAKAFGAKEPEGFCFFLAIPASIFLLWYFWETLHPLFVKASEWGAIVLILFFLLAFVIIIIAAIAEAFKRENIEGTMMVLLIAAGTIFIYIKTAWGFWLSLLAGFGAAIVLWLIGGFAWDTIKRLRHKDTN